MGSQNFLNRLYSAPHPTRKVPKLEIKLRKTIPNQTTSMEDDINGRQPQWKMNSMEDDQNWRLPKWKTALMEDNFCRWVPYCETTSMEDDLNERRPQWKMTSMEDDLNDRWPQWKMTSMEYDLNGRRPQLAMLCAELLILKKWLQLIARLSLSRSYSSTEILARPACKMGHRVAL